MSMKGNQHYSNAEHTWRNGEQRAIQATLALAYEQRTANLIAAYNGDVAKKVEGKAAELYPLHNEIVERLGLA